LNFDLSKIPFVHF